MKTAADFQTVLRTLKTNGFLVESDPKLPSVVSLITGEPLRGSWWSHPLAQIIFQTNEQLSDHDDVLLTKLVSGKVTFAHRNIWSEVVAIARAREPWQIRALPKSARTLLKQVEQNGSLVTSEILWPRKAEMKLGDAARELEKRLLVVGTQFHSATGAHQKRLETWEHWIKEREFKPTKLSAELAKECLASSLRGLNEEFGSSAKLPWQ